MTDHTRPQFATVSSAFVADWLTGLRPLCTQAQFTSLLSRSDLLPALDRQQDRVTLDQIVRLYQLAAVETGDEMMGLWSRPIRPRALQHLLTSVREATTLASALYRFSTFWNLLLDDYRFTLTEGADGTVLTLEPLSTHAPQRFGHMLILKLAHGLVSWLARREVPLRSVAFAFGRPGFAEDYAVIFPAPVTFDAQATSLCFDPRSLGPAQARTSADLDQFLINAPRDWIFTRSSQHTQALRVRGFLVASGWERASLDDTARSMGMTPRTLIRRLDGDGTSFQAIKDALRRDMAIGHLQGGRLSIEAIAQDLGFSSSASFHKAFQRWTGSPPSTYRRKAAPDP